MTMWHMLIPSMHMRYHNLDEKRPRQVGILALDDVNFEEEDSEDGNQMEPCVAHHIIISCLDIKVTFRVACW